MRGEKRREEFQRGREKKGKTPSQFRGGRKPGGGERGGKGKGGVSSPDNIFSFRQKGGGGWEKKEKRFELTQIFCPSPGQMGWRGEVEFHA